MREYLAEYYATRARRSTLWIIAAHAAFFAALLAVMFYLRWVSEAWPTPFHFASLLMVAALTMFAISGSATLEMATRAAKLDDQEPAVRWVAVGIASWLTFLFLEIVEWVRLVYLVGLGPQDRVWRHVSGAHRRALDRRLRMCFLDDGGSGEYAQA